VNQAQRPTSSMLYESLASLDPAIHFLQDPNSPVISTYLVSIYSTEQTRYLLEVEAAQSRLSSNISDTLSNRLKDSDNRFNTLKATLNSQLQSLQTQLANEQSKNNTRIDQLKKDMAKAAQESSTAISKLESVIQNLQLDVLHTRFHNLPPTLSTLFSSQQMQQQSRSKSPNTDGSLDTNMTSLAQMDEIKSGREMDLLFQPSIYDSVTIMVISIVGFNRLIQRFYASPKTLIQVITYPPL
jgi:ribosomal protein L29